MKKVLALMLALLMIAAFAGGTALVGSADENYNGEDGEQPGIGVDAGPGETHAPASSGDRMRFKDA
jgi:hypothetical protein